MPITGPDGQPWHLFDEQPVLFRDTEGQLQLIDGGETYVVTDASGAVLTPHHPDTLDPLPLFTVSPGVVDRMILPVQYREVRVGTAERNYQAWATDVAQSLTQVPQLVTEARDARAASEEALETLEAIRAAEQDRVVYAGAVSSVTGEVFQITAVPEGDTTALPPRSFGFEYPL